MNTPVNHTFTIYIKVGCKGVYITRTCYHDKIPSTIITSISTEIRHKRSRMCHTRNASVFKWIQTTENVASATGEEVDRPPTSHLRASALAI